VDGWYGSVGEHVG